MKAFEIQEFGIDKLTLSERPDPKPGPGQVLVKVAAASLNYRDLMVAKGSYNPKMRRPMIPLSDGAGVVTEVGPGVTRWKSGDRVAGIFFENWVEGHLTADKRKSARGGAIDGMLAEYVVSSQDGLVATPETLTDEEAATLPCAAVTAWHALFEHTRPAPGETVLLQGTGGVSLFALQFARAAGMRIILTSSSDEKLSRARQMGAHETINYNNTPDWDVVARELTGGRGVDHVVEVGGKATLDKSIKSVRPEGTVSVIGVLTQGGGPTIEPSAVLSNAVRLQGIYVGSAEMFGRMNRAIDLHKIKPQIDQTFTWTEYPKALRHMEGASHFGKIVLRLT